MLIKIDGKAISPSPSEYSVSIMDLSTDANRTMSGLLVRTVVSTKRKIQLSWPALNKEQVSQLLKAVSPSFFQVEYIDPQENSRKTGVFYCGDRTVSGLMFKNDSIFYKDIKFDLIER